MLHNATQNQTSAEHKAHLLSSYSGRLFTEKERLESLEIKKAKTEGQIEALNTEQEKIAIYLNAFRKTLPSAIATQLDFKKTDTLLKNIAKREAQYCCCILATFTLATTCLTTSLFSILASKAPEVLSVATAAAKGAELGAEIGVAAGASLSATGIAIDCYCKYGSCSCGEKARDFISSLDNEIRPHLEGEGNIREIQRIIDAPYARIEASIAFLKRQLTEDVELNVLRI